jgi:iron complex transport system permease protein
VLAGVSIMTGVENVSLSGEWSHALDVLMVSRVPRTLALVLSGAAMAVAGLLMQMVVANRYVEPSTTGTVESATLGMLFCALFFPELPVMGKLCIAAAFALAGTGLFLAILQRIPLRSVLMVPLAGLMLTGIINAVTTFFAYRFDLMQSLNAWVSGDFSFILMGRYELLWIAAALTLLAYTTADRFTVAGMGRDTALSLGLDYRRALALALVLIALVTACVTVTVGMLPFVGLVVPNAVRLAMGDNTRRTLPWVAGSGAGLVLACDIAGRMIRQPYEIPVGTVLGVVGSAAFVVFLMRQKGRVA